MLVLAFGMTVQAKEAETIKQGIFADGIDLSGMTVAQATATIEAYVEALRPVIITLEAAGGKSVDVTAGDLGIIWSNRELVEDAIAQGRQGNVIQRYKALKDLEHENYVLKINLDFDIPGNQ